MQGYKIGYKRPPISTRFQPGTSGNPTGRPKGIPSLKTDLVEALSEMTTVGRSKITKQRAVINGLVENAMGRDTGDIKLLLTLYLQVCGIEIEQESNAIDYSGARERLKVRIEGIAKRLRLEEKLRPEQPDTPEKGDGG